MLYLWPVSDFSWAPVLAALARAFAERGMRAHAEKLAQFKARYEEQQRKLERLGSRRPWTTEDLVRHAAALQIAPFAGMVPVVPISGVPSAASKHRAATPHRSLSSTSIAQCTSAETARDVGCT